MWQDPIVAEIRRIREEYAARFNYEVKAICDAAREQQETSGREAVDLTPTHAVSEAHVNS